MLWSASIFYGKLSTSLTPAAVFQGSSTLLVGAGPLDDENAGKTIFMKAGDAIVLPAGVSHCSKDFQDEYRYIGVYPEASGWLDGLNR